MGHFWRGTKAKTRATEARATEARATETLAPVQFQAWQFGSYAPAQGMLWSSILCCIALLLLLVTIENKIKAQRVCLRTQGRELETDLEFCRSDPWWLLPVSGSWIAWVWCHLLCLQGELSPAVATMSADWRCNTALSVNKRKSLNSLSKALLFRELRQFKEWNKRPSDQRY